MGPLVFDPVYQPYVWGGKKLVSYRSEGVPTAGPVAESWEVSTRSEGMSVVSAGPHRGETLAALIPDFPLLFKVLDAAESLSLQVHPDDAYAERFGGEAKNEMWVILDAEPGAGVYLGFKEGVSAAAYDEALAEGALADLLAFYPASKGDVFWVPGGRVHAIAAGCLLYEVQQNSNTTYRLHDWDRLGLDGQPRELHLEQGRQVIRWEDAEPVRMLSERLPSASEGCVGERLLRCPYFSLERWTVEAGVSLAVEAQGHAVLFVVSGEWQLEDAVHPTLSSILFPQDTAVDGVAGANGATVLLTRFD